MDFTRHSNNSNNNYSARYSQYPQQQQQQQQQQQSLHRQSQPTYSNNNNSNIAEGASNYQQQQQHLHQHRALSLQSPFVPSSSLSPLSSSPWLSNSAMLNRDYYKRDSSVASTASRRSSAMKRVEFGRVYESDKDEDFAIDTRSYAPPQHQSPFYQQQQPRRRPTTLPPSLGYPQHHHNQSYTHHRPLSHYAQSPLSTPLSLRPSTPSRSTTPKPSLTPNYPPNPTSSSTESGSGRISRAGSIVSASEYGSSTNSVDHCLLPEKLGANAKFIQGVLEKGWSRKNVDGGPVNGTMYTSEEESVVGNGRRNEKNNDGDSVKGIKDTALRGNGNGIRLGASKDSTTARGNGNNNISDTIAKTALDGNVQIQSDNAIVGVTTSTTATSSTSNTSSRKLQSVLKITDNRIEHGREDSDLIARTGPIEGRDTTPKQKAMTMRAGVSSGGWMMDSSDSIVKELDAIRSEVGGLEKRFRGGESGKSGGENGRNGEGVYRKEDLASVLTRAIQTATDIQKIIVGDNTNALDDANIHANIQKQPYPDAAARMSSTGGAFGSEKRVLLVGLVEKQISLLCSLEKMVKGL